MKGRETAGLIKLIYSAIVIVIGFTIFLFFYLKKNKLKRKFKKYIVELKKNSVKQSISLSFTKLSKFEIATSVLDSRDYIGMVTSELVVADNNTKFQIVFEDEYQNIYYSFPIITSEFEFNIYKEEGKEVFLYKSSDGYFLEVEGLFRSALLIW